MEIVIRPSTDADAGELLTVQRAAYVIEAQRYDDPYLPPLTETLADVQTALTAGAVILVARSGPRLVGSVRGQVADGTGRIGRLAVAPDLHGRGIGGRLLQAVEASLADQVHRFELFTGARSAENLRFYRRFGYTVFDHRPAASGPGLVYLQKAVG